MYYNQCGRISAQKVEFNHNENETDGEKRLWIAVIQDALERSIKEKDSSSKNEARRFFRAPGEMFERICNWLNYDADAIRERLEKKWK